MHWPNVRRATPVAVSVNVTWPWESRHRTNRARFLGRYWCWTDPKRAMSSKSVERSFVAAPHMPLDAPGAPGCFLSVSHSLRLNDVICNKRKLCSLIISGGGFVFISPINATPVQTVVNNYILSPWPPFLRVVLGLGCDPPGCGLVLFCFSLLGYTQAPRNGL